MTPRTVAQHLASRDNLRQRHYAPETERARAARKRWQQQRVELTPETDIQCEWGETKGKGDATIHCLLHLQAPG